MVSGGFSKAVDEKVREFYESNVKGWNPATGKPWKELSYEQRVKWYSLWRKKVKHAEREARAELTEDQQGLLDKVIASSRRDDFNEPQDNPIEVKLRVGPATGATPYPPAPDLVNHPPHYTSHPSGLECIQVTEYFNFCIGNAIKYLWRCDEKGNPVENLEKARWYIDREIQRRLDKSVRDGEVA